MRGRAARQWSGVVAVALVASGPLAGCSIGNPFQDATPLPSATSGAPPGLQPLAPFYDQVLTWTSCELGQCATLTVPLDYQDPEGATIGIALNKAPATRKRQRLGSLVVNPGGPGASGIDYAKFADSIVGTPVRQRFDIVGFDPRGVARSHPIDCLDDEGLDDFLAQDPTPDDPAEESDAVRIATQFGQACNRRSGALLGHVSTVEAAKDLDILRAALGDAKLNLLGKSYGTFLGATYAGLFPDAVGRVVLDGALAPDLTADELFIGQAKGFEMASRAWAEDCVDEGNCPLGDTVDEVLTGIGDLLTRLDRAPLPVTGDARVTSLTEGWGVYGIAEAMYDQGAWRILTEALRDIVDRGDGSALMGFARSYAKRNTDGVYTGNLFEVFHAVNCLDRSDSSDVGVYRQRAARAAAEAPIFGRALGWANLPCGHWPVEAGGAPERISAAGSGPIVIVGTTRDPATPYEWAPRLAEQLENGVLVTFDGDGHTAYTRSNDCVDDAIDDYFVAGTVPEDGLRC